MVDSQLRFDIIARDKASTAFRTAGDSMKTFHSNLDRVSGRMRSFGGAMTAGITVPVVAGAAAVVGFGFKTAAAMEQAQIGFTTMLHSGQKAQDFLSQLKDFAAHTPFELSGLIETSRLLIGVGATTQQTMGILRDFGDTAAAMGIQGDAFNRAMVAVSQAMAAGSIHAQDMNQLIQAGIPVWKLMSEATGKPIPVLKKLSEQGQLLTKDILPVLQAQMHKDYGGSMQKQSETLTGKLSNLKDMISQGLGTALTQSMPQMKKGIQSLTDALPGLFNALGPVLAKIGSALGVVAQGIARLLTWFNKLSPAQQNMIMLFGGLLIVAGPLISVIGTLAGVVAALVTPVGAVVGVIVAFIGGLVVAYRRSSEFREMIAQLTVRARELWDLFIQKGLPVLKELAHKVLVVATDGFKRVMQAIKDNRPQLDALFSALKSFAGFIMSKLWPVISWIIVHGFMGILNATVIVIKGIGALVTFMTAAGLGIRRVWNDVELFWVRAAMHMLEAAQFAFSWIPGIGPKLQKAHDQMAAFVKRTNAEVAKITAARTVKVNVVGNVISFPAAKYANIASHGLAGGGRVMGPGGDTADKAGLYALSNNEWVIQAKAAKALGPRAMHMINNAHRQGWDGAALLDALGGRPLGMAAGGVASIQNWIRAQDPKPYVFGAAGPDAWDCSSLTGGVYALLRGQNPNRRYFTTSSNFGALGFMPGPGLYTIGVNPGSHMMGNLAGLNFEAQNPADGIRVGSGTSNIRSFARMFHMGASGAAGLAGLFGLSIAQMSAIGGAALQREAAIVGQQLRQIMPRARGGPALPGRRYLVGEDGPEVLTMGSRAGHISPAGMTIYVTVNVPPTVNPAEVGRLTWETIQAYATRNGGLRVKGGVTSQ